MAAQPQSQFKVVIPWAKYGVPNLVKTALQYDCDNPRLFHCQNDDSYYELLRSLWHEAETFIIVEHDIIPWPGAVTKLADCPQPWCLYAYNVQTNGSLGCTKFNESLLRKHPDLLDEPFCRHFSKRWCELDGYLGDKMIEIGVQQHIHKPNVAHLHAHECYRRGYLSGCNI